MKYVLVTLALAALNAGLARGQTIDPYFAGAYTYNDLGSAPDVPPLYGGLTLLAGTTNTLLLGGYANEPEGTLYAVGITRDTFGHISGFTGVTTVFGPAPYNDGGVAYGPGGVLFASQWPVNKLSQYLPGSTAPDKVIDLNALGVSFSHASINFVPAGHLGAGRMKLCSWEDGEFYDATYVADGAGTWNVTSATQTAQLAGGPEGFVYVPLGSPLFSGASMLVSEYSDGNVAVYDVNAEGDPIAQSRRAFITGLTGAEGAFIDPYTGDFLFSTFGGGDRIIAVQGFVPEPGFGGFAGGLTLLLGRRRRAEVLARIFHAFL